MASLEPGIQPLHDRILVRRLEQSWTGKILPPQVAVEPSVKCEVLAVGPGKMVEGISGRLVRAPLDVKPGDIVWIGPYFDWDEKNLVLCQEGDVRAKLSGRTKRN